MKMRGGRLSFILGREEKSLLDELQVSHIQNRRLNQLGRTFRVLEWVRV
jgi:hypothetical protein